MSGILRGWLTDQNWETTLTWANACGALAVSRHGCAPAYPSWQELQWLLENGSEHKALRKDVLLEHVHWATNRDNKVCPTEIADLRSLGNDGAAPDGPMDFIGDWHQHRDLMYRAIDWNRWIGRSAIAGSTDFREWPTAHCVVCPVGDASLDDLMKTCHAARTQGLEVMLELTSENDARLPSLLDGGVWPDYWILPAHGVAAQCELLLDKDPWCRGVYCAGGLGDEHGSILGTVFVPQP